MAWVKLDDGFFNNRKIVSVSKDAKLLYLAGLCYAGSALTDGEVPSNAVPILAAQTGIKSTSKLVNELVRANLWTKSDSGFAIHDYLTHNQSADKVRANKDAARSRMQRSRSQNVRANKSRSSQDVREPDTDTDTDISPDGEREGGADAPAPPTPTPRHKPKTSDSARSPRGTRLPADFAVTDEMRSWAREKGLDDAAINEETEKFREWWPAQPGQKGVKADWQLTWQTWIRRAIEQPKDIAPVPIRNYGRQPANMQTHGHDDDIDYFEGYAPKTGGTTQ